MRTLIIILISLTFSASTFAQIHQRLDAILKQVPSTEPGLSLLVEKEGKIIYKNGAGVADTRTKSPITSKTNFRMASLTKQFTAMAILLLERDKRLSVDDPISKYLPELPASVADRVKIRHLLTHSSGLMDYESLMDEKNLKEQLLDRDILEMLKGQDSTYFEPGTRFRYSNSGFCLLTLVIERASSMSFPRFVMDRIFAPLGMKSSVIYEARAKIPHRAMGYARNDAGEIVPSDQSLTSATKGDGGVYTSIDDYVKWVEALRSNKLLDFQHTLNKLTFKIVDVPDSFYGAGWFISTSDKTLLFHSGSTCGFSTFTVQIPEEEFSLVYFSNIANNDKPFAAILDALNAEGLGDLRKVLSLHALTR